MGTFRGCYEVKRVNSPGLVLAPGSAFLGGSLPPRPAQTLLMGVEPADMVKPLIDGEVELG